MGHGQTPLHELCNGGAALSPLHREISLRAWLLGELMYRGSRLFSAMIDVHSEGQERVMECRREGHPLVFVGWHGHDAINLTAYRTLFGPSARAAIMVLDDANGHALGHFASRMQLRVVSLGHDPESAQWARGVVTLINLTRHGYDAMIAADGPHGPALEAKAGAALIAQRANALMVPCVAACSRTIELKWRWDNHLVPLPFSRALVHFGAPIDCSSAGGSKPDLEDLRAKLGAALQQGSLLASAKLHERRTTRRTRP